MTPAWPIRQIVLPLGAGTLSGVSAAAMRPVAGLDNVSEDADGDTSESCVLAALTVTDSVTTPGFIFVRAGGGVGGMPDEELPAGCKTAFASGIVLPPGDAVEAFFKAFKPSDFGAV